MTIGTGRDQNSKNCKKVGKIKALMAVLGNSANLSKMWQFLAYFREQTELFLD
jgi:hypothetical protein